MPDCKACKEARLKIEPVPYIVHEAALARLERVIRRLWILLIILLLLFVGTNAGWIYYESQFEIVETTTTDIDQFTRDGGNNFIVGGDFGGETDGQDYDYTDTNP